LLSPMLWCDSIRRVPSMLRLVSAWSVPIASWALLN